MLGFFEFFQNNGCIPKPSLRIFLIIVVVNLKDRLIIAKGLLLKYSNVLRVFECIKNYEFLF